MDQNQEQNSPATETVVDDVSAIMQLAEKADTGVTAETVDQTQPDTACTALIARDQQLLRLPLVVPAANDPRVGTWRLSVADAAALKRWLD